MIPLEYYAENSRKEPDTSVNVFLDELLKLGQGERFLIYIDQGSDPTLVNAVLVNAEKRNCKTEILKLDSGQSLADQAGQLSERIKNGGFDAICELSRQYFYHTLAWQTAREMNARVYSIAGLNVDSFVRCVGDIDHEAMFQYGKLLMKAIGHSRSLRIFTKQGTDIRMQFSNMNLAGKVFNKVLNKPRSFVLPPDGLLSDHRQTSFLGGQLVFNGVQPTINGTAVIDGYLWPPSQIGLLDEPIILEIEKGKIVEIGGNPVKAKILRQWFNGQPIPVMHFCMGFNPGARLSGNILETERMMGGISVGIGRGAFHTDGIMKDPSIEIDQHIIEENGSFKIRPIKAIERQEIEQKNRALTGTW